jgi:Uma2 family endonuclease
MNEIARFLPKSPHSTTQVADGLPRLKWTLDEFEALSELGFFGGLESERERLELVGGELIPMNAKGRRHEWVRGQLFLFLARALPAEFSIYGEPGWRPGGDLYLEPEMLICKAGFQPSAVPPSEVLLLIEVADTSFKYDAGLKAKIYASLGVREYWVVNAKTLETTVHLDPASGSYGKVLAFAPAATLAPQALPVLAVSLGDLKLG